jgi:UbiD family decarboxylase
MAKNASGGVEGRGRMPFDYGDLREFIARVGELGALRHIDGADPEGEVGGVTEIAAGLPECPALLFDAIKGYPRGFRIFTNATVTPQRAALALGLDPTLPPLAALAEWKARRSHLVMHEPVIVGQAAFDNSRTGADVDIGVIPAPLWHRRDGGRFIGSAASSSCGDPDSGWVNASIYRVQVHGPDRVTIQFDHEGRHGAIIARRWWECHRRCPVHIVYGPDPALFIAGFEYLPEGVSEYAFAGAIRGRPLEVVAGR